MNTEKLIKKANYSPFHLWLLNMGLFKMIPFNKPHRLRILNIQPGRTRIHLPYIRKNLNHLKGLHACALATLAEYSTGLALITSLESDAFRIIMKKIDMEYFFQGKSPATADFSITEEWLRSNVLDKVETGIPALVDCSVDIYDQSQNKLATGKITWQIKSWKDVKTQV